MSIEKTVHTILVEHMFQNGFIDLTIDHTWRRWLPRYGLYNTNQDGS